MAKSYFIYNNKQIIGSVDKTDRGLYAYFYGKFCLKKGIIWRIIGVTETSNVDFGIALFDGTNFVLNKKIPHKQLGDKGIIHFEAINNQKKNDKFIIDDNFDKLELIEKGRLCPGNNLSIIFYSDHTF